MTTAQIAALISGLLAVGFILVLVRRRQLREKYAGLWLVLGAAMGALAVVPSMLDRVAGWLGVADPPNLLFFIAILVLLTVTVQLSYELSRLEERIRTLAEDLALLRADPPATQDDQREGSSRSHDNE